MAITNNLSVSRSVNGIPVWGRDFPMVCKKVQLTANTVKELIVPPGGFNVAVISTSSGANVQVSPSSEVLPTTGVWQDSNAQMQMPAINLDGITALYFVSPNDDYVYVAFSRTVME